MKLVKFYLLKKNIAFERHFQRVGRAVCPAALCVARWANHPPLPHSTGVFLILPVEKAWWRACQAVHQMACQTAWHTAQPAIYIRLQQWLIIFGNPVKRWKTIGNLECPMPIQLFFLLFHWFDNHIKIEIFCGFFNILGILICKNFRLLCFFRFFFVG